MKLYKTYFANVKTSIGVKQVIIEVIEQTPLTDKPFSFTQRHQDRHQTRLLKYTKRPVYIRPLEDFTLDPCLKN